jgi:plastocyanin
MRRTWFCLAAFAAAALLPTATAQPPAGWATLKGQIVFPANVNIPPRAPLNVTQDKAHCLSKGPILDDVVIVNPANRGIKNVVVWLRPNNPNAKATFAANEIHPGDANRKPADVVIDQPCCMFTPRITLARVGDTIVVKNPAPVAHNFSWTSGNNGEQNPVIQPGGQFKVGPLLAESTPIPYKCTIHPWMSGTVRIFEHPYAALTDDDGKFTIPNAPVGNYALVAWHEKVGFDNGKAGRTGTPVMIQGPTTELPPRTFTTAGMW